MASKTKVVDWICDPCGLKHGKWYQPGAAPPKHHCATYHVGTCDLCGKHNTPVTEPRDYGYLMRSCS